MTGVDWIILAALLLSVLVAAAQGFFYEVFSLAGVVAGYLVAAWEYPHLAGWLSQFVKDHWVAEIAGFLIIFLAVVVLAGIVGRLVRWAVKEAGLRWFDRVLGGAFGLLRGVLLVSIVMLAATSFPPVPKILARSELAPYFLVVARAATWAAPSELRYGFRRGMDALRGVAQHEESQKSPPPAQPPHNGTAQPK